MKNVINKKSRYTNVILYGIIILILFIFIEFTILHISNIVKTDGISITSIQRGMDSVIQNPFDISSEDDVMGIFYKTQPIVLLIFITILLVIYSTLGMKSEFDGIEHGSASWATSKNLKYFKKDTDGFIIGDKTFMPMESDDDHNYNLNQFVIGGPGSGKTFRKIKPDVMQVNSNFIITDSKGDIYKETINYLLKNFYTVKVLNLIDLEKSNSFNPFKYLKDEKDVLILTKTFIQNTESDSKSTNNDSFWTKAETSLLQSLIFYVLSEQEEEEHNFISVIELLTSNPGDEQLKILDYLMADLKPSNPARQCYNAFKLAAGETSAGILIGLAVRFNVFSSNELKNIVLTDEMNFDSLTLENENCVYFIIIPDTHRTFDVLSSMFFSQLFQHLTYKADSNENKSLPRHCRFLMDEFSNVGVIPDFDSYLSTIRSRNMSATIILQELQQLKKKYKDNWETIIGCCDTIIFMGSPSNSTREYISKMIGKTTIHNINKNRSNKGGSEQRNNIARDLLSPTELREISIKYQIVIINGIKPIYIKKFKTEKEKIYNEFTSTQKKNEKKVINKIIKLINNKVFGGKENDKEKIEF